MNSNLVISGAAGIDGDATSDLTSYGMLTLPSTIAIKKVDVGVAGDMTGGEVGVTIGEAAGLSAGMTLYAHTEKKEGSTYNEFTVGALVVESTGTLTLVGYDGDDQDVTDNDESGNDDYGVIVNADSLDVKSGAVVTSSGQGFAKHAGPGYLDKSGGSHGGYGSKQDANVAGGTPCGDVYAPITLGSGGDTETNGEGGPGGGAVKFNLTGDATINGSIVAQGSNATGLDSSGGAGGSVWVVADSVSGSGAISVNGGTGGHESYGRCGSGGRVAINYTTASTFPAANITAYGGAYVGDSGNGGPGTIYIKQGTGAGGDLYVDNNDRDYLRAAVVDDDTFQFNKITLTGEGNLDVTHVNSNLSIQNENGLDGDGTGLLNSYGMLTIPSTFTINKLNLGVLGDISGGDTSLTVGEASGSVAGLALHAHTEKREGISYNEYTFGDLTVKGTGTVTLVGYNGDDQDPADNDASGNDDYGVILNADNIIVDASGEIIATGYAAETGEGTGAKVGDNYASGGGHGGYGATVATASGGTTYGAVYEPITLGSGGGGVTAGAGGGAVKLLVSESLVVNGTISGNGKNGTNTNGGGAGGSLWISSDEISGTGTVTANGGNGGSSAFGDAGGGSGGRIAFYYTTSNSLPLTNITAYSGINSSNPNRAGGPGTVYVKQGSGAGGNLFINNNGKDGRSAGITDSGTLIFGQISLTNYGDLKITNTASSIELTSQTSVVGDGTVSLTSYGQLIIPAAFNIQGFDLAIAGKIQGGGTSLNIGESAGVAAGLTLYAHSSLREGNVYNEFTFGDVTVDNTGTLTLIGYDGDSENSVDDDAEGNDDYGVILNSDNLTVNASGVITANGYGFSAGSGTGVGENDYDGTWGCRAAGGGHGGYGADTNAANHPYLYGGTYYGSITAPLSLGSGGGICSESNIGVGGEGGGAMKLVVGSEFAHNGQITANAINRTSISGGGGSGGSVWVSADVISGTGTVKVNGGTGKNADEGGGAGGRVAIYYQTSNTLISSDVQAYGGGSGSIKGGPGTIFIKQNDEEGSLYVDNSDAIGSANAADFEAGDYDFKDVVIGNNVKATVKSETALLERGVSMNLTGSFTLGTGAYLDGDGQGFSSGEGPGAGANGSIAGGGDGSGGGGGAHGGEGGIGEDDGVNGTTAGGSSYGSSSEPLTLGSGGGASGAGALGGAGGGAFGVYAFSGVLTVNGTIDMDGANGLTSSPGGGGGAGGGILLKGKQLILGASSVLTSNGGNGGNDVFDGGGGGGGRIAILYGDDGYSASGTVSDNPGTGYQVGQEGTTLGPLGYPNVPEDMDQLELDDVSIPVGGTTPQTTVKLKFLASDADPTDTLTPQIEIRPIGTDFTNIPTHTGTALSYSGIPLEAEISISGLVLGTSYHWQARVQDSSGVYSSWISYGGNSEAQADFSVTEATKFNLVPSVGTLTSGGYFTITLSAVDDNDIVDTAYRGTAIFTSSDPHAILPSNHEFTSSDVGTHEFTNEFMLGTLGNQTVTATDSVDSGITGYTTINVISGGDISQNLSTVEVNPAGIENDGEDSSTITVTLKDGDGDPVIGREISLTATGSGNTLTQPVFTTDVNGKAYGSIVSTVIGQKVISATVVDEDLLLADTATVTVSDSTPPVISNIQVTNITNTSATISWQTNESATGQVEYGIGTSYGITTDYDNDFVTSHSVNLTDLNWGTTYHFRILARDAALNDALSSDQTFNTLDQLVFETFLISDVSVDSALVKWSTNVASTAVLSYGLTTSLGTDIEISDSVESHEYLLSDLEWDTKYYVRIVATSGSWEVASEIKDFTTLADENAVRITDIEVRNIKGTSATVTFGTTKPATIVLKYGETTDYEDGELTSIVYSTDHAYNLQDLTPDTVYHFRIVASDQDTYVTTSPDQEFRTTNEFDEFGIIGVETKRNGDNLIINWGTTMSATCVIEYGQTTDYGLTSGEYISDELNRYQGEIDISQLDDIEIHYRIKCTNNLGQTAITRDLVYSYIETLPITAVSDLIERLRNSKVVTATAKYAVPALSFVALIMQLISTLATLGGLVNITSRFGQILGAIFDKERKRRGWGVVYDLHRSDPVPFAIVRLFDARTGKIVEEAVTDLKGRYRFAPKDGKYTMGIRHSDYILPEAGKEILKGMDLTGKYLGGEVDVKQGVVVSYDIPLISKAKAEEGTRYRNYKDTLKIFMNKYGTYINLVGGVLLILSLLISPRWWNWVLLSINVLILALFAVIKLAQPKDWGRVYDVRQNRSIKGAFVRLFDEKEKKLINTLMSDDRGRYGFLVNAGKYLLVVSSPGYEFPGKKMRVEVVESKVLGKALKVELKQDEVLKQNLPVKSVKKTSEKEKITIAETPFGA